MAVISHKQLYDFTGGINFRADQFQLAPNESPNMLNVEIDPRGGIFSRAGYQKKNTDPVSIGGVWKPKTLYNYKFPTNPQIMLSTGYDTALPTNGAVYRSIGNDFSTLDTALATPLVVRNTDGASFTQWESTLYMAVGIESANMYKWIVTDTYALPRGAIPLLLITAPTVSCPYVAVPYSPVPYTPPVVIGTKDIVFLPNLLASSKFLNVSIVNCVLVATSFNTK